MATIKLDGWVEQAAIAHQTIKHTIHHSVKMPNDKAATLVIHDGPSEPVLTQSEHEEKVKAIVQAGNDMRTLIARCMNIGIDTMYATQAWDDKTHHIKL